MSRYLAVCYGAVAYLLFVVSFVYAIGFLGNFWVPRSVDHALSAPVGQAVLIDVLLLGDFAIQHRVMARGAFFWLGWATAFFSSFMVSHFDLFGLRQVYLAWRGQPYRDLDFRVRFLYRLVRQDRESTR